MNVSCGGAGSTQTRNLPWLSSLMMPHMTTGCERLICSLESRVGFQEAALGMAEGAGRSSRFWFSQRFGEWGLRECSHSWARISWFEFSAGSPYQLACGQERGMGLKSYQLSNIESGLQPFIMTHFWYLMTESLMFHFPEPELVLVSHMVLCEAWHLS